MAHAADEDCSANPKPQCHVLSKMKSALLIIANINKP